MKVTHVWQKLTSYLKDAIFRQLSIFIVISFPEFIGGSLKIGKILKYLNTDFEHPDV